MTDKGLRNGIGSYLPRDVSEEKVERLFAVISEERDLVMVLLMSQDNLSGLMTSDFLVLRRRMTAAEAIQAIRDWQPTEETIY